MKSYPKFPQARLSVIVGPGRGPDGKAINTHFYHDRMGRDTNDLTREIKKSIQVISADMVDKYPGIPLKYDIENRAPETWCCGWFSHWTFRDLFTKEEAVDSFYEFVGRYSRYQDLPFEYQSKLGNKYRCLMGAEDYWRWRATDTDPDYPCSCEHCIQLNRWVICH